MRSKWRTVIFIPASRSEKSLFHYFYSLINILTVYATNLLYPTSRCSFYNITVADSQIDPKSSKKILPKNNNNQLKLIFYGVPYIYVLKQCLDCNKMSYSFTLVHYFIQNHTKFLNTQNQLKIVIFSKKTYFHSVPQMYVLKILLGHSYIVLFS